jgi:hypothetical protein
VVGYEHVRRLQVPVDDPRFVGRGQGVRDLGPQVEDLLDGQGLALDPVLEGPALHPLHHDVRAALVVPEIVDDADMGVVEPRGRACLALEALEGLGVLHRVVGQELQGDVPPQVGVFRLVHHPHPSAAELGEDSIVRDGFADHRTKSTPRH